VAQPPWPAKPSRAHAPPPQAHPALVNGAAGVILTMDGQPYAVFAFAIAEGKIVQIDAVADPDRVARLAAPVLASAYKGAAPIPYS
jgi:hypothetical protein